MITIMRPLLFIWAIFLIMLPARIQAREVQALFSYAAFYNQAEGPYLETYLKVYGPSVEYAKTERGTFQASLKVTMLFKVDDKVVDYRKYNLLSAEVEDTALSLPNFIDQQRITLPNGAYRIELSLADNNSGEGPIAYACDAAIEFDRNNPKFSDFEFVDSFTATRQVNILSKSGFDMIPYAGDFFPQSTEILNFYTELYNLDKKIGENQGFLFRYYIESAGDSVVLDEYSKFQRQNSAMVNPLLVSVPIAELATGSYNLVVEAINRNNELILRHKAGFERDNPGLQVDESAIKAIDVSSTFAEKITPLDSLQFYLKSLTPIGSIVQNQYVDKLVKTDDFRQMQKFLFSFWKTRNDQFPEAEWESYKAQVLAIEDAYKTKVKHGFETDMGYTWLRYGTPNEVDDVRHEPNAPPYIIWKYYHIDKQMDVRFVFSNPQLVGTEYVLTYSNARDNRVNADSGLYNRAASFGTGGGWGSRYSSNFRR
jgi:GWxTD domain-containing protein